MQRILYVCASDPDDVSTWSGLTHFIGEALRQVFSSVEPFVLRGVRTPFFERVHGSLQHRIWGRRTSWELRRTVAQHYGRQIDERLSRGGVDAVFAPGTLYLSEVSASVPLFATADACFGGLVDYYPEFTRLTPRDLKQGFEVARRGAQACATVFYASEWARDAAVRTTGIDPAKAVVVPFGANLARIPSAEEVNRLIAARPVAPVRLLYIGVDWERKGGAIALEAARELRRRGMPVELHLVGRGIPQEALEAEFVHHHGFLRKSDPGELATLGHLLGASHVLVLPTRAECFGVVFVEASAYGVPSLATDTGGVRTAVRDGINGWTFPLSASGPEAADLVQALVASREGYERLCRSARALYEAELNWRAIAETWKRHMVEAGRPIVPQTEV